MTNRDIIGLLASYLYAGGLLVLGEVLQRFAGVPGHLTRKLVHIGAGMWAFGVLALFDTWQIGVLPFATFIVLNYLFYRYRVFRALDSADSSPGTIYFAVVITLLFVLLWRPAGPVDRVALAMAGVMTMTWGDALAALFGRAFGRRRYQVGRSSRTIEGSLVMLLVSVAVIWLTLVWLPGSALAPLAPAIAPGQALLAAVLGAVAATAVEAVSPHGSDNLSVPLITTLAVGLVVGA